MKNFFATIWTFWVALVFIITGILAFIGFIIVFNIYKGRKEFTAGVKVSSWWSATFMFLVGMPVKAHNKKVFNKNNTYVVISNHLSQLDIPATLTVAPIPLKFLSKKEVEKMPVIGYALKRIHLMVDRKSKESRAESQRLMAKALANGESIIIFCEGTRNPGPGLTKDFYDGGFRLAIETGTPVIVQTVVETWERQNANMGAKFLPGLVNIYYDGPIETSGMTMKDIPQLKEQVRQQIEYHLREKYGDQLNPVL